MTSISLERDSVPNTGQINTYLGPCAAGSSGGNQFSTRQGSHSIRNRTLGITIMTNLPLPQSSFVVPLLPSSAVSASSLLSHVQHCFNYLLITNCLLALIVCLPLLTVLCLLINFMLSLFSFFCCFFVLLPLILLALSC